MRFSVVLSEAKDLIAACHGHEILRFAQDDCGTSAAPASGRTGTWRGGRRPSARRRSSAGGVQCVDRQIIHGDTLEVVRDLHADHFQVVYSIPPRAGE